jgi:hypothetical protein
MALPRTEDFAGAEHVFDSGDGYFQQDATCEIKRDGTGLGSAFGAADGYVVDTQNTYDDDQYSKMVFKVGGTGIYCQVMTRGSITDKSGYAFYTNGSSGAGNSGLQRWNAGTAEDLGAVSETFADGDVMEMHSVGDEHFFYKNGSPISSITDSSGSKITSGAAGYGAYAGGGAPSFNDWQGGNHQEGGGGGGSSDPFVTVYFKPAV